MKTDATKKLPGEGHKRAWPPLIKMDESVKAKIDSFVGKNNYSFGSSK
jgi:4-hydroxy-3-polyprenylbenzoate decarboxylase